MTTSSSPFFPSKLPNIGTTIFTVMSELSSKNKAINLGQGFPDFGCDEALIDAVNHAMLAGHNQYPPMAGVLDLRQAISQKIDSLYFHQYDPLTEITITAGATQGILNAILCCVNTGDEVIIIEPAFDSYLPAIHLAGGIPISVQMEIKRNAEGQVTSFEIPWDSLGKAINHKTRLLIINTPHNPTGTIWQKKDWDQLAELIRSTDCLILSDEVYEHMIYDHHSHSSVANHPELVLRSFLVSSFGKTYHVTGWKVGFVAAPAKMSEEFRKVHQFNVFTVNTPMQYGLTKFIEEPKHYLNLASFYQKKRDLFRNGLSSTKLQLLPNQGTYFQCADYSNITTTPTQLSELEFCRWLTIEKGVAAIPLSAFYSNQIESGVIRFCFAKQDSTLNEAISRLQTL